MTAAAVITGCGGQTKKETETAQVQTDTKSEDTERNAETEAFESETGIFEEAQDLGESETQEFQTEETELEKIMYALDDVYIRGGKDAEAEAAGIAKRGSELTVTKQDGDWCKVSQGDIEGYIMSKFLTESQEEAQNAVAAQEAAEEAARAAEQAAQAAAQNSQSQGGGKQEVSRQNFDDCDGSGHGYTIITYSDGSTETVEY